MTQTSGTMLEDLPADLPSADRPPIALPDTSRSELHEVGGLTGVDSSLVAELLPEVESHIRGQRLPIATYRLQFNSSFTFRQATELVDYLDQLGITDLYASPLFQAREGSQSGYDVADYSKLSEELGTREEFDTLATALRQRGLGLILDIVPNHMTTASPRNRWWLDVLENGALSPYASYFDIDWMPLKTDLAH